MRVIAGLPSWFLMTVVNRQNELGLREISGPNSLKIDESYPSTRIR